jgi:hypothetical protein
VLAWRQGPADDFRQDEFRYFVLAEVPARLVVFVRLSAHSWLNGILSGAKLASQCLKDERSI